MRKKKILLSSKLLTTTTTTTTLWKRRWSSSSLKQLDDDSRSFLNVFVYVCVFVARDNSEEREYRERSNFCSYVMTRIFE